MSSPRNAMCVELLRASTYGGNMSSNTPRNVAGSTLLCVIHNDHRGVPTVYGPQGPRYQEKSEMYAT